LPSTVAMGGQPPDGQAACGLVQNVEPELLQAAIPSYAAPPQAYGVMTFVPPILSAETRAPICGLTSISRWQVVILKR